MKALKQASGAKQRRRAMNRGSGRTDPDVSGAPRARVRSRARYTTRLRLVGALATVLAASSSALVIQVVSLWRMEAIFAAMGDREERMRIALQLEVASDAYAHQASLALADGARLTGFEEARARALELATELRWRSQDGQVIAWTESIRAAASSIDEHVRPATAPGAGVPVRSGGDAADALQPLLSRIERDTDALVAHLQEETAGSRRELIERERATLGWTAALLIAMPLLVAAAALYLSRSVARPLTRLGDGAAAIAGGNLAARIEIETPDEFGALAAGLNAMSAALGEHQAKLQEAEKLAELGRLAAGVAHEINNPLQVMIGYLSMNRDVADPRLAGQLAAVEAEAMRCKTIVDDLLQLSRPAARFEPVDLRALCDDVAHGLRAAAYPRPLRLTVNGAATALGDDKRLRQVVLNLVKNAVEAGGPAGEVVVALGTCGAAVELAVRDSGPGITAAHRARLFEPFFTTKPAGTGLGLAMSRAIALAHGGEIGVEMAVPHGAVFTVRLPAAAAQGG
jgi:signal transduction histidine kinase